MLLVEDSAPFRERLATRVSELHGAEVYEAPDVDAARAWLAEIQPAAVILDVRLPGGSGLDVLRELHSLGIRALVVVLTLHPVPQLRTAYLAAGADLFLDKAHDVERALSAVRQRLEAWSVTR